jgi:hypothetical protein
MLFLVHALYVGTRSLRVITLGCTGGDTLGCTGGDLPLFDPSWSDDQDLSG